MLFAFFNDNFSTLYLHQPWNLRINVSQPENSVLFDRQNWILMDTINKMKHFYKLLMRSKATSGTKGSMHDAVLPF